MTTPPQLKDLMTVQGLSDDTSAKLLDAGERLLQLEKDLDSYRESNERWESRYTSLALYIERLMDDRAPAPPESAREMGQRILGYLAGL